MGNNFFTQEEDYHEQSSRYYWSFFKGARLKRIIASLEEIKDTLVDVIDSI